LLLSSIVFKDEIEAIKKYLTEFNRGVTGPTVPDVCVDGWMHGCMDVCMDGCMDAWVHGWMDR
jgi:hypothetical protein